MQEKDEKYTALYKTQDKILEIVARENLGLYLTGGTALQNVINDVNSVYTILRYNRVIS